MHGIPRATMDGDVVAEVQLRHCRPPADSLSPTFLGLLEAVIQAVHDEKRFNVIHRESFAQLDVFAIQLRGWQQSQMQRRQLGPLGNESSTPVFLASPEDTIAKLDWYRLGGGVLGVIKIQAENLDVNYLRHWAAQLRLTDLRERALGDGKRI